MVQENSLNKFAIVICGPTGSGKSKLAYNLCERFNGEVVSADSIAIYRGLDIGSAKPTEDELSRLRHHMINVADPKEDFSVAQYREGGRAAVEDIFSRGKVPVVCGGTGYYIDSIFYDFSYGNCPKNDEFREKCEKILTLYGAQRLHDMLKEVDPDSAATLHPNDSVRTIRALEIYHATGTPKSQIKDDKKPIYPFFAFSYEYDRAVLYQRINKRVDAMFDQGLLGEVENLLSQGVEPSAQSMQGIGYKEVVDGLLNNYSLDDIKELVKRNTRRYAKRQITWFKRFDNITFLKPDEDLNSIITLIEEKIYGKASD